METNCMMDNGQRIRVHHVDLNGQVLNWFDVYESGQLAVYAQAQRESRLCIAVGPTGCGKTFFYDFVAAQLLSCRVMNLSVCGQEDVKRVVNCACSLGDKERISIAFYPKPETWPDTKATIEATLYSLKERSVLSRLVGIELSLETEFVDILTETRLITQSRNWCILEFPEWTKNQKRAFLLEHSIKWGQPPIS